MTQTIFMTIIMIFNNLAFNVAIIMSSEFKEGSSMDVMKESTHRDQDNSLSPLEDIFRNVMRNLVYVFYLSIK